MFPDFATRKLMSRHENARFIFIMSVVKAHYTR